MSSARKRRPTELRLDKLAEEAEKVAEGQEAPTPCPMCQGQLLGSRLDVEGGDCRLLRCQKCGYVYMKRT